MTTTESAWVTWGRLLRLPNLFTVPGDAAAGLLLASGITQLSKLPVAAASALCLYMGGLLLNDFFDREEDARERPERPIPSGAAPAGRVSMVGILLLLSGWGLAGCLGGAAAGIAAGGICICVVAYDGGGKRVPVLGACLMGACRAGSILLGASLCGRPTGMVWVAAAAALVYTLSVTIVAANETSGEPPGLEAFLPGATVLMAGMAAFLLREQDTALSSLLLPFLMVLVGSGEAFLAARRVKSGVSAVPPFIGRLIRIMLSTQAFWCLWALRNEVLWLSCVILVCFLTFRVSAEAVGKRFYGS